MADANDVVFSCACDSTVAGGKSFGRASLYHDSLRWTAADDSNLSGARVLTLMAVTQHQRNKPGSATASLRLVPDNDPKRALVLTFASESERDSLSDHIKTQIKSIEENRRGMPSNAEVTAREELLKTNADLATLYEETVKAGVITAEDFWEARRNLFSDAMAKKATGQKHGIENTLEGDLKGSRDGISDTVTCNLTNEKMHRIFAERPSVRQAFLDNVPKKMTEREFWTRFLRSEYFKQMRAGAPPQGEEEASDLALFARKPPDAATLKAQIKSLAPQLNLKAAMDDELGEGYGFLHDGARDSRRPKEAGALPEVFSELNHHAAVVLRGQPQANIVDARSAAIAARDHEKLALSDKDSGVGQIGDEEPACTIEDLASKPPPPPLKELRIRDSHQYFSSIADEQETQKPSTSAVIVAFKDAVAAAAAYLQPSGKKQKLCALEPGVAAQVLKEVIQSLAKVEDLNAQFASQQSFSKANDADEFPKAVDQQLKRSAATGAELLRQFWISAPMNTSVRWEKAAKVSKSLENLYDKLEQVKNSLSAVHRHTASQRLRPLLQAFDSAFTFYDDEKLRRPRAFAEFEQSQHAV